MTSDGSKAAGARCDAAVLTVLCDRIVERWQSACLLTIGNRNSYILGVHKNTPKT